jgi:hypothetical protein
MVWVAFAVSVTMLGFTVSKDIYLFIWTGMMPVEN